ncbi:MAG TPA: PaaI family thioesterase [Myxococcota bacterium]|jgi:acyl-coenzyme A thioesterase PaaI-like protein|nr:PaaI family thioesterase [Myxococcota bacterium]
MSQPPVTLDAYTFGKDNQCFGCGPHNAHGMQLKFEREGETVTTRFVPRPGLEGPPGIFHGGLQTALADDLAGWTIIGLRGRMGFTSSMSVRFVRPMRLGLEIVGRGRIVGEVGRLVTVKTTLEQEGRVGFTARIVYALPDRATATRVLGRDVPEEWMHLCEE